MLATGTASSHNQLCYFSVAVPLAHWHLALLGFPMGASGSAALHVDDSLYHASGSYLSSQSGASCGHLDSARRGLQEAC